MSYRSLDPRPHGRFLKVYLEHKWWVLVAGLRVGGIPLGRLILHDLSKMSPQEWPAYVERYGAGRGGKFTSHDDTEAWRDAYAHHVAVNAHHWEHWRYDTGHGVVSLQMPEEYVREMVADWMAAGKAYTGTWDHVEWYEKNKSRLLIHPRTRQRVEQILAGRG